ncbi:MAG: cyclic nucleotide-binding domain-containing protein [Treponema sp.]|jgi:CRP-like cAMP-binding protein|nr:cyclic nucleotide-binding domain-containing protein [Treponema sp.]
MIEAAVLKKYAFFGGLRDDQIEKILPIMRQEDFEAERDILVEGAGNDKIHFILEGRVVVSRKRVLICELAGGDSFGEMEVLDVMPAEASVKSLSRVSIMSISNRGLHEIYKTDLQAFAMVVMNLARDLSRRIRKMDERVTNETPLMEWN